MRRASQPAMTRKTTAMRTYMMPIFLWSTVVTHSWSTAVQGRPAGFSANFRGSSMIAMSGPRKALAERSQVADDVVALFVTQAEGRHQATRLDLLRVGHPAPEVLGVVFDHARGERVPTHQMRKVGGVRAVGRRAADSVAVDARPGEERRPAGAAVAILHGRFKLVFQPALEVAGGI